MRFQVSLFFLFINIFGMAWQTRVYDNKADRCGPIYVTIGDGGNREGLAMS